MIKCQLYLVKCCTLNIVTCLSSQWISKLWYKHRLGVLSSGHDRIVTASIFHIKVINAADKYLYIVIVQMTKHGLKYSAI